MDDAQARDGDPPPSDIKQLYRSVYSVAKQLDEHRQSVTNCSQLFDDDPKRLRSELITQIDGLIFQPHTTVGRKSREILWRKGFYDIITCVKRQWSSTKTTEKAHQSDEMVKLIREGISVYRSIVVRMDRYFEMDLRNIMDFSSLLEGTGDDVVLERRVSENVFPLDLLNYAVETVHAALLSLGDLHRYYIDFNFDNHRPMGREMAARYYHDAFQLNTKLGMAQNQLGTLFSGQRYDLDAIYHYLYSLVCPVPFELSENNVSKIFTANADYLKMMVDDNVGASIRDFMARLKLIADILFYDKSVSDFNSLCHCLLIDLRSLLSTRRSQLTNDFLLKVVGVMMFCLTKLTSNQSPTVHSLNALLVAICSEMVDSTIGNLEKFIASRADQNAKFQETYGALFELFDRNVRLSRKAIRKETPNGHRDNGTSGQVGTQQLTVLASQRKSLTSESSLGSNRNFSDEKPATKAPTEESRKKVTSKVRRRRRRLTSDNFESNSESDSESDDYELDSDFSSIENSSEDESDDDDDDGEGSDVNQIDVTLKATDIKNYSDSEDLIVEEEHLIYRNDHTDGISSSGTLDRILMKLCQITDEEAKLNSELLGSNLPLPKANNDHVELNTEPGEKLRYKRKYNKIDPNIIIEFAQQECTLQALKILFDWLKINYELLINCFASNPEFVHKIMRLMNYMNVDMFTRKVCFDRSLVKTTGLRSDMEQLFEARATIPLQEDLWLKDLPVLAVAQQPLDFERRLQLGISTNEEHMMRLFKLIDFGFFACKTKQFGYNFCARSRVFVEAAAGQKTANMGRKRTQGGGDRRRNHSQGDRVGPKRGANLRRRKNDGRGRNRNGQLDSYTTSNDENEVILLSKNDQGTKPLLPKKSYLKNRNHQQQTASESDADLTLIADHPKPMKAADLDKPAPAQSAAENKFELMGKLWLRNEVKALESEVQGKTAMHITPFLVIDALALTDHAAIVKALVKTKKFVVLIPSVVLTELDEMKKSREDARNAIRWLESEFSKGSRFLRMQRSNETLAIPLLKTPRKFDREIFNFLQVAQFCNYMQSSHADLSSGSQPGVLTLLTGARLTDKKSDQFSYSGIMKVVCVQFESISTFYAKYKNK